MQKKDKVSKMRNSVAKVARVYQEVRMIALKCSGCATLEEVKIQKDLGDFKHLDWRLSPKEEKSLKRLCKYLGI